MDSLQLLLDLHKSGQRQGPGGEAETEKALRLAGLDPRAPLKIADLGCGTGASTLALARRLNARITAADFLADFLEVLEARAKEAGLAGKITTLNRSMDDLPFDDEEYDVIWSEGAIYNIGFARGVREWNRFLKKGGALVVSEITWLTGSRPAELQDYWEGEYPEIATASAKIGALEDNGYSPVAYFVLPRHCWVENYYQPLRNNFQGFLERNGNSAQALAIVEQEKKEMKLYEKFRDYYSYGVYIARKIGLPPA